MHSLRREAATLMAEQTGTHSTQRVTYVLPQLQKNQRPPKFGSYTHTSDSPKYISAWNSSIAVRNATDHIVDNLDPVLAYAKAGENDEDGASFARARFCFTSGLNVVYRT